MIAISERWSDAVRKFPPIRKKSFEWYGAPLRFVHDPHIPSRENGAELCRGHRGVN